jgi:hypothetical protein
MVPQRTRPLVGLTEQITGEVDTDAGAIDQDLLDEERGGGAGAAEPLDDRPGSPAAAAAGLEDARPQPPSPAPVANEEDADTEEDDEDESGAAEDAALSPPPPPPPVPPPPIALRDRCLPPDSVTMGPPAPRPAPPRSVAPPRPPPSSRATVRTRPRAPVSQRSPAAAPVARPGPASAVRRPAASTTAPSSIGKRAPPSPSALESRPKRRRASSPVRVGPSAAARSHGDEGSDDASEGGESVSLPGAPRECPSPPAPTPAPAAAAAGDGEGEADVMERHALLRQLDLQPRILGVAVLMRLCVAHFVSLRPKSDANSIM